jgi:hypothetical protein
MVRAAVVLSCLLTASMPVLADATVVLIPLVDLGVRDASVDDVDLAMRVIAADLTGSTLVAKPQTAAALQTASCDPLAAACALKVGKALGATDVLVPTIARLDEDAFEIVIKSVDVEAGIERTKTVVQATRAELPKQARAAVVRAIDPSQEVGRLLIKTESAGAQVFVDGQAVDRTPMLKPAVLPVGPRTLEVRIDGYPPWQGSVDLGLGEERTMSVVVDQGVLVAITEDEVGASAAPGLQMPLFIAAGAAGALSAVVLAASGVTAAQAVGLREQVEGGNGKPDDVALNRMMGNTTIGLWAGAGALAVVGVALAGAALVVE